jgi:hypothetical protein
VKKRAIDEAEQVEAELRKEKIEVYKHVRSTRDEPPGPSEAPARRGHRRAMGGLFGHSATIQESPRERGSDCMWSVVRLCRAAVRSAGRR